MKIKFILEIVYFSALMFALFILGGCSTCPGSQNPVVTRYYNAVDILNYPDASQRCILSKTYNATRTLGLWSGKINYSDYIDFDISDEDQLTYLRYTHGANYENLRTLYNRYMSFFKKNGSHYRHGGDYPSFTCEYLVWSVRVDLRGELLRVTARRIEF